MSAAIRGRSNRFVVVASSLLRNCYRIQCGKVLLGELGYVHRAPIQTPQALIFLSREQYDIVAAMAGHNDRFAVSNAP